MRWVSLEMDCYFCHRRRRRHHHHHHHHHITHQSCLLFHFGATMLVATQFRLFHSLVRSVWLECLPNFHVKHKFYLYSLCVHRFMCFAMEMLLLFIFHFTFKTMSARFSTFESTKWIVYLGTEKSTKCVYCVFGAHRKQNTDITKWNVFYLFVHCINQL